MFSIHKRLSYVGSKRKSSMSNMNPLAPKACCVRSRLARRIHLRTCARVKSDHLSAGLKATCNAHLSSLQRSKTLPLLPVRTTDSRLVGQLIHIVHLGLWCLSTVPHRDHLANPAHAQLTTFTTRREEIHCNFESEETVATVSSGI